jgi:hypothetical protein
MAKSLRRRAIHVSAREGSGRAETPPARKRIGPASTTAAVTAAIPMHHRFNVAPP